MRDTKKSFLEHPPEMHALRTEALQEPWPRGGILWITGLSGAGKTTLAQKLHKSLAHRGQRSIVLDGDALRQTLNSDLGYSPSDRRENIRRAGEVAAMFCGAGFLVIAAFISPYRSDRDMLRQRHGDSFHEVWLSAPLSVCESRDPKGLYAVARRGEIAGFTGIAAPYEVPLRPDLILDTARWNQEECTIRLLQYVEAHFRPRQTATRRMAATG